MGIIKSTLEFGIKAYNYSSSIVDEITGDLRDQMAVLDQIGGKFAMFSREASAAMIAASQATAKYNDSIQEMAKTIGRSREEVELMGGIIKRTGGEMSDYVQIMAEIQNIQRMYKAGEASDIVMKLKKGQVIKKGNELLGDELQIYQKISNAYQKATEAGEGHRWTVSVLGREWTKFSDVLALTNKEFDAMTVRSKGGGTSLFSEENIKLQKEYRQTVSDLGVETRRFGEISQSIVTPAMIKLNNETLKFTRSAVDLHGSLAPMSKLAVDVGTKLSLLGIHIKNLPLISLLTVVKGFQGWVEVMRDLDITLMKFGSRHPILEKVARIFTVGPGFGPPKGGTWGEMALPGGEAMREYIGGRGGLGKGGYERRGGMAPTLIGGLESEGGRKTMLNRFLSGPGSAMIAEAWQDLAVKITQAEEKGEMVAGIKIEEYKQWQQELKQLWSLYSQFDVPIKQLQDMLDILHIKYVRGADAAVDASKKIRQGLEGIEAMGKRDIFGDLLMQLYNLPNQVVPPLMDIAAAQFEKIVQMRKGLQGTIGFKSQGWSDIPKYPGVGLGMGNQPVQLNINLGGMGEKVNERIVTGAGTFLVTVTP